MRELLTNKDAKEKASIKAKEIAKLDVSGEYKRGNLRVEFKDIQEIEGGVQVLARAWKGNNQLGFGADGSVEWERFRIFNPPILVADPNGDVVRDMFNDITNENKQKRYREDPLEALKQVVLHAISITGKENTEIKKGKIGNTTSTFYPDPDPETTSCDGGALRTQAETTFATVRGGNGTATGDSATVNSFARLKAGTTLDKYVEIRRSFFLFDTSTIPDADTISSATFSFVVESGSTSDGLTLSLSLVGATTASNTAIAQTDYEGTVGNVTKYASDLAIASVTADGTTYNDMALNATGIAAINQTGITKLGGKTANDADNSAPTWASSGDSYVNVNMADIAGTSEDPKLVVVHAGSFVHKRSASGGVSVGGFGIY